jgi:hypothetical protein
MKGIGGNTELIFQISTTTKNSIGEQVQTWADVQTIKGWLDLSSGNANYTTYNAKVQESTHMFIADYVPLDVRIKTENTRAIIDGGRYDVMLLDNPMGMKAGSQWEIYLKHTGRL